MNIALLLLQFAIEISFRLLEERAKLRGVNKWIRATVPDPSALFIEMKEAAVRSEEHVAWKLSQLRKTALVVGNNLRIF